MFYNYLKVNKIIYLSQPCDLENKKLLLSRYQLCAAHLVGRQARNDALKLGLSGADSYK